MPPLTGPARTSARDTRLAAAPVLALVVVVLVWNAAAFAIDASPLGQRIDSWGIAFGSVLLSVVYGTVPLVVTAGTALAAAVGPPAWSRPLAWCGAVVVAVCGLALLVLGASTLGGPAAEVVFGLVSWALAPVLLAPLVVCVRRRGSDAAS